MKTKILIVSMLFSVLAHAATVTVIPGVNLASAINSVQNGDTLVLNSGSFSSGGEIDIVGKNNITITAANVGTVASANKDGTGPCSGPNVTINGSSRYAIKFTNCQSPKLIGVTLKGGGWRFENCPGFYTQDVIVDGAPYAGGETDTPGSPSGAGRFNADGSWTKPNLVRVAAQNCGCIGFNFSSTVNLYGSYVYEVGNNPGLSSQPSGWPSSSVQVGGKWYAVVQDSGGGGKWCILDTSGFDHLSTNGNTGIGWWLDVNDQAVTLKHSQMANNKYVQNGYDGIGSQVEIANGPTDIEDCYFAGNTGGAAIDLAESVNVTVNNSVFNANNIWFRDILSNDNPPKQGRGVGFGPMNITNDKFYNGATITSAPASAPAGSIITSGNQNVAGNPTWTFFDGTGAGASGATPTTQPTPAPIPTPTPATTIFTDAAGNTFSITTAAQVIVDGTLDANTNGVTAGQIINGSFYQTAHGEFWEYVGGAAPWQPITILPSPTTAPTSQPAPPAPTLTNTINVYSDGSVVVTKPGN